MKELNQENRLDCVVDSGTIFSKRDMIRILRDLDRVEYVDLIDSIVVSKGIGFVIEVYANNYDSTLIFNNRLHINVNGFDFIKIKSAPNKQVDLISGHRAIRLTPVESTENENTSRIEEEIDEQRITIASQLACGDDEDLTLFPD